MFSCEKFLREFNDDFWWIYGLCLVGGKYFQRVLTCLEIVLHSLMEQKFANWCRISCAMNWNRFLDALEAAKIFRKEFKTILITIWMSLRTESLKVRSHWISSTFFNSWWNWNHSNCYLDLKRIHKRLWEWITNHSFSETWHSSPPNIALNQWNISLESLLNFLEFPKHQITRANQIWIN